MATEKRKVSLIQCKDYPREKYAVNWTIFVDGDLENGYTFKVCLDAYAVVGWLWEGKKTIERPDVTIPVYPPAPDKKEPVEKHQEHRRVCCQIYESHPKPIHCVAVQTGKTQTRDEADTAAQQWVLDNIEEYKLPEKEGE